MGFVITNKNKVFTIVYAIRWRCRLLANGESGQSNVFVSYSEIWERADSVDKSNGHDHLAEE